MEIKVSKGVLMIPEKHKAILLKEFGKPMVVGEVATPKPVGDAVLIKTISVGICHSDVLSWKGKMGTMPLPMVLGHEIVGTIIAKGERVPENLKEGDTVLVYVGGQYAKEDKYTRRGLEQHAKTWIPFMGGLQEYVLVSNHRFLVNVNGLEDIQAVAPLSCAALASYNAVKKTRWYVEPEEYVAIVGLGGLGSYATQWVNLFLPYANLIGVDVKDETFNFTSKLSKIDAFVNPSKEDPIKAIKDITRGEDVKAIIDFVGSSKTVATYTNVLSPLGIYVIVGLMEGEITFSRFRLGEAIIQGSKMGSLQDQYDVIEFARKKHLNYNAVVTRRFKFEAEQVTEAFKNLDEGKVQGRQIIII
jgi:D-arabinose 1-dehydrogenase-like Zn-dependent alcohol dehydrogenase